jgi:hypothetical protein
VPVVVLAPSTIDATVTVENLVNRVYTHLEPSSFGYLNRLASDITDITSETLVVERDNQAAAIKAGAYICVDIEVMYVWDYDPTTKTVTVQRGMLGSVATTHDTGALIQVQPRVSKYDVLVQLRDDIRSWPPSLFVPTTAELTEGTTSRGYDLAGIGEVIRPLRVRVTDPSATSPHDASGWRYVANADPSDYPSGKALVFDNPATSAVQFVYAAPFDTLVFDLDTPLAQVGLTEHQYEIPVLGAAARLVREAPRTDTRAQGQSRLAEEVPPMHLTNTSKSLMKMRDDRIHQEIARLRETYPQRRA